MPMLRIKLFNNSVRKIDRVASQVSQTETKVDSISNRLNQMYIHLQDHISKRDTDLRQMINNHIWGPEFNKKKSRSESSKLNWQELMLKRLVLPFLLKHKPQQYLLRSLKLIHLSTHQPDLNNLFTISSLDSPSSSTKAIFTQKNQDPK